ncbi:MAG: crotonase/enoyl-CoA hydratase family protein [Actinobacteria bacterium]|nr:crotonase/enoyl-CoA hydratase family protein [Actinomycetota bacterium]MBW3646543.1 crotonase/enoyl-CoA hydratase family protein [Actinomycetota bacterium]
MSYRCFDVDIADRVAHVRLSRPEELNTMTPDFWRELPEIVTSISDEASARVVVITSTGKHFSAGMDLSVFAALGAQGDEPGRAHARTRSHVRVLQWTFTALEKARVPVLAAVQGGVIGGAVDLVTACDLRYASAEAFFCVQEVNLGMTADVGTLQRLGRLVGDGFAREMAYTGRRVPAARAYEAGLVQRVYADHDALVTGVLETAREIAVKSPLAIWGTKVAMNYARDHPVDDALEQVATWQAGMFQPADLTEAMTARAERREPRFPELLPEPRGL